MGFLCLIMSAPSVAITLSLPTQHFYLNCHVVHMCVGTSHRCTESRKPVESVISFHSYKVPRAHTRVVRFATLWPAPLHDKASQFQDKAFILVARDQFLPHLPQLFYTCGQMFPNRLPFCLSVALLVRTAPSPSSLLIEPLSPRI